MFFNLNTSIIHTLSNIDLWNMHVPQLLFLQLNLFFRGFKEKKLN